MTVNFLTILIKLALGLISLVFVINVTGKGNLAPSSAVDQIQNFVLGGIIGGVIYNSSITILQYIVILLVDHFDLALKMAQYQCSFYEAFD